MTNLLLSFFLALASTSAPNPKLTPGALCTAKDPHFAGIQDGVPMCRRSVSARKKARVFKAYGVTDPQLFEIDHRVPLCLGGRSHLQSTPRREQTTEGNDRATVTG
jgi:hypothetical protein